MKKKKFLITNLLIAAIAILSCNKDDITSTTTEEETGSTNFTTGTKDTTFANAVVVVYDGTTATVTNPFETSGVTATVSNGEVIITSTVASTEINYVLSGISTEGTFKLYSDYKFNLILNGVGITNSDGPAINIQSGKKVTVNVLTGTNNRLIDGSTYASSTEDQKAAFFSEGQLNFTGTGALAVTGKYKHAICSDDYIYIKEGNITVAAAVSDGIHANDYFKMDGGTVTLTSSGDGIDCEEGYISINAGNITVNSVDDGITASYEDTDASITPYIEIKGGVINVTTTGDKGNAIKSESYTTINSSDAITLTVSGKASKGIKTTGNLAVTNGKINVTTSGAAFYDTDDADIASAAGINCDGNLSIADGTIVITSTGIAGKGITTDGTTTIDGGAITITTSGTAFTYGGETSEGKAIKSDAALTINNGKINISSADDGIKSATSVTIKGGTVNITKSTEGIEAPLITFNDGNVSIAASDDAVNATNGNGGEGNDGSLLTFAGGTVALSTTGGDAIDGNGNIVMTGGTVIAQGPPSSPEVAIDYNGSFKISGGLLIASGPNSGNMAQATSTSSDQYAVMVKTTVSAGTLFNVQDANGTSLITYAPVRAAYYFVFSSSALQSGSSYKVFTGGSCTGTATNGYYSGGTYSGGTQKGSFTVSGKVTNVTL